MIKAIETVYNGYRFRSRLEARWAVFFDTLGVKYEYEKEGYDLDGTWYLPDFWLPELKRWIEIKGQKPTGEECAKAQSLFNGTSYPACIFYGLPGENEGLAYYTCSHESGNGGDSDTSKLQWAICPVCRCVDVTLRCHSGCNLFGADDLSNSCIYVNGTDCVDKIQGIIDPALEGIFKILRKFDDKPMGRGDKVSEMLEDLVMAKCRLLTSGYSISRKKSLTTACDAARQARFERGQQS